MTKLDHGSPSIITVNSFSQEIEKLAGMMTMTKPGQSNGSRGHLSEGLFPEGTDYLCSVDLSKFKRPETIEYDGPSLVQMFNALYVGFAGTLDHLKLPPSFFDPLAKGLFHAAKHGDARDLSLFAREASSEEREMIDVWVNLLTKIVDKAGSQYWMLKRRNYVVYKGKTKEREWVANLVSPKTPD